jgi:hypothetical protein
VDQAGNRGLLGTEAIAGEQITSQESGEHHTA